LQTASQKKVKSLTVVVIIKITRKNSKEDYVTRLIKIMVDWQHPTIRSAQTRDEKDF
jgi:hypothetical protein